jgi:putative component of toxin-antitoxin plasmid stabilization module
MDQMLTQINEGIKDGLVQAGKVLAGTMKDLGVLALAVLTPTPGDEELAAFEGGRRVVSRIRESRALVRAAETLEGRAQADVNTLVVRLAEGNMNPGIGNRYLFNGVMEARAESGARVYFRSSGNVVEILGKSTKHNQQQVINVLERLYR